MSHEQGDTVWMLLRAARWEREGRASSKDWNVAMTVDVLEGAARELVSLREEKAALCGRRSPRGPGAPGDAVDSRPSGSCVCPGADDPRRGDHPSRREGLDRVLDIVRRAWDLLEASEPNADVTDECGEAIALLIALQGDGEL